MDDNFLAFLMIAAIIAAFAIVLLSDTNPLTGVRHRTLGGRLLDWYCSWPLWDRLGDD